MTDHHFPQRRSWRKWYNKMAADEPIVGEGRERTMPRKKKDSIRRQKGGKYNIAAPVVVAWNAGGLNIAHLREISSVSRVSADDGAGTDVVVSGQRLSIDFTDEEHEAFGSRLLQVMRESGYMVRDLDIPIADQ